MQFYYIFKQCQSYNEYANISFYIPIEKLPKYLYKKYESKIDALSKELGSICSVLFTMLEPTQEEQDEIVNLVFREHVDICFNDNIYFYEELMPIIFDEDNNARLFDESMFKIVKHYAAKFNVIDLEAIDAVREHSTKIKDGLYSDGVKKLSDANMHESEVTFEIEEPYIIANFGAALYHHPMRCKFHAIFNDDLRVFDGEIIESEVLINADGTFQYNALVYVPHRCENVSEIKITFHDVEVEEGVPPTAEA